MLISKRHLFFQLWLRLCMFVTAALAVLIFLFLLWESWPALQAIGPGAFFTDADWLPSEQLYNIVPMILASFACVLAAMLISTPLGIFSAVGLQFYLPPSLRATLKRFLETMTGMPSVVFGFFGLVIIVPAIASVQAPGVSLLAAALVLSMMILPALVLMTAETLASTDSSHIRSAISLGLSKSTVIQSIILPVCLPGIFSALRLQAARAIGETMAVLMVAGNIVQIPGSIFEPVRTLTANIALEMAYATEHHRAALFSCGLILLCVVLLLASGSLPLRRKAHA